MHCYSLKSGFPEDASGGTALLDWFLKNESVEGRKACLGNMEIINGMPFPANANVRQTLLAASRAHRNLELGKLAADKLISLQKKKGRFATEASVANK